MRKKGNMRKSLANRVVKLVSLLSLSSATVPASACGLGSSSITGMPGQGDLVFQVNGLSAGGQLTGSYYGSSHPNQDAFLYSNGAITDLGGLGGSMSEGLAINGAGTVAGDSYLANFDLHAFVSQTNGLMDLGTLGGTYSSPFAINDAGQVVGASYPVGDPAQNAFLYSDSMMINLGTLGGNYSVAFSVNKFGSAAGESSLTNGDIHGFVYTNGAITDVGTLGGNYSSMFSINNSGTAVGQSTLLNGNNHACQFSAGQLTDLGTLGGTYSSAFTINANGQIIGIANTANDAETHGFVYLNGVMTDIGTLGGNSSFVMAQNNKGQVVGYSALTNGANHALLWQAGTLVDLNSLLPANSGWELTYAQFINDAGRIVGTGTSNGVSQPFIMDLIPANNPPVAVAGADQTLECGSQVTLSGSQSSDPDGDPLTFQWTLAGNVLGTNSTLTVSLPMGTNVLTLTVTDTCGASSQANVSVILRDTTAPTGSCPGPVTASSDANCQAAVPNVLSQIIASDNCTPTSALTLSQDPAPGTMVGLGPHPIMVTVTDPSGNSSTCSVLFTVSDTQPPAFVNVPQPFTLSADANCQAVVPDKLGSVIATDNCTPANQLVLSQNPAAGTVIGSGSHSLQITVTDASGNHTTTSIAFQVTDTTAPVFTAVPEPITLYADANCQAVVPNVFAGVVVQDNCTPANQLVLSQNPTAGTVVGSGSYPIVVIATDAAGNQASASVSLTVVDVTPPTFLSVPGPLTIAAGTNCQGTVPNVLANVTVTDNCTPTNLLMLSQNPSAGTSLVKGQYVITVVAADIAGNSSTQYVSLTIADQTPPTIQSLSVSPNVLTPPNGKLIPVAVSISTTDNCDTAPVSQITSITCSDPTQPGDIQITGPLTASLAATKSPTGGTRVYTLYVQSTDSSGNSIIGTVTVSVPYNQSPKKH